jgi:hypothetical protein
MYSGSPSNCHAIRRARRSSICRPARSLLRHASDTHQGLSWRGFGARTCADALRGNSRLEGYGQNAGPVEHSLSAEGLLRVRPWVDKSLSQRGARANRGVAPLRGSLPDRYNLATDPICGILRHRGGRWPCSARRREHRVARCAPGDTVLQPPFALRGGALRLLQFYAR